MYDAAVFANRTPVLNAPVSPAGAAILLIFLIGQNPTEKAASAPEETAAELERRGDMAGAAHALEPLLAERKEDAAFLARIGNLWSLGENYQSAEKYLSKAVELDVNNRNYWILLGEARFRGQEYHKSIEAFTRALQQKESDGKAENGLGACYFSLGDRDAAKPFLLKSESVNPRMIGPRHLLGKIALDEGDYKGAIHKFNECLQLDPRDAESLFRLGLALRRNGELEASVKAFREAIANDPLQLGARLNLGQVLIQLKREDEGKIEIEAHAKAVRGKQTLTFAMASLRLDPNDPRSRATVGDALLELGLNSEALLQFREALRAKRPPVTALLGAARACAGLSEIDAQIHYAQKAYQVLSRDPRARPSDVELAKTLMEPPASRGSK